MRLFIHPRFPELCICLAEHGWGGSRNFGYDAREGPSLFTNPN